VKVRQECALFPHHLVFVLGVVLDGLLKSHSSEDFADYSMAHLRELLVGWRVVFVFLLPYLIINDIVRVLVALNIDICLDLTVLLGGPRVDSSFTPGKGLSLLRNGLKSGLFDDLLPIRHEMDGSALG
jgi:hypothetical protein